MRTVLVTGAGGAGRSTVAAATALRAARDGSRVLLLTPDPEALGELAAPGLSVVRLDAEATAGEELVALQERHADALDLLGATPLAAEELTPLPGTHQLALLRALSAHADGTGAEWDLVVVDMQPAPEALAVLALPEQLRRYLRRLLPPERQAARALRPLLAQLAGVPAPAQQVYEAAARWERRLAAVQRAVEAPGTTVRIVLEPGRRAARELRRTRAALALQGCRTDAVIANKVLPAGSDDAWLAALAEQQRGVLKELGSGGTGTGTGPGDGDGVCELPHLGREPHGTDDLQILAAALPPLPAAPQDGERPPPWTVDDLLAAEGVLLYRLPLPGAERDDLTLVRRGDELIVTVAAHRRALPLPSALRRCTIAGAALRDGELRIRFTPDPGLWPKSLFG